jgi:hypothetical protein
LAEPGQCGAVSPKAIGAGDKRAVLHNSPARAAAEREAPTSGKGKEKEMTYHVQFHWGKWEVVREPDHRLMRQCNSKEEADNHAAKLSSYDELLAELDQVLAFSTVPMAFPEAEGAAA